MLGHRLMPTTIGYPLSAPAGRRGPGTGSRGRGTGPRRRRGARARRRDPANALALRPPADGPILTRDLLRGVGCEMPNNLSKANCRSDSGEGQATRGRAFEDTVASHTPQSYKDMIRRGTCKSELNCETDGARCLRQALREVLSRIKGSE